MSEFKPTHHLAYAGDPDCTSMTCRRMVNKAVNFMGHGRVTLVTTEIEPGCMGWHCAVCREPSSQYGHEDCHHDGDGCLEPS